MAKIVPTVNLVVPLDPLTAQGSQGARGEAWQFVKQELNNWPIVEGCFSGNPWVKALAVDAAMARCAAEVVVVHDADVLVPDEALQLAVAGLDHARWAIPHGEVWRYDEPTSRALYEGRPLAEPTLARWPYRGVPGGGIVVMRREDYEDCPLDPGFLGWGAEDQSWGWALEARFGEPWRGDAPLVHLWHPQVVLTGGIAEHFSSELLRRNYRYARRNAAHLDALLDRARAATRAARG